MSKLLILKKKQNFLRKNWKTNMSTMDLTLMKEIILYQLYILLKNYI